MRRNLIQEALRADTDELPQVAGLVSTLSEDADTDLVIAALLHDTIEDAGVTEEKLRERFGGEVAGLVLEVTDDKSLPKEERKRLQIVNAPKKYRQGGTGGSRADQGIRPTSTENYASSTDGSAGA